jgi:hypothetical protein
LVGRKLPPCLSESDTSRPACGPLREPVTVSTPKRLTGSPRKAICVWGEATRAPGIGYTLTTLTTRARGCAGALALALVLVLAPARAPTPQPLTVMHTPRSVTAEALTRPTDRLVNLIYRCTAEAVRRTDDGIEELGQVAVVWQSGWTNRAAAEHDAVGSRRGDKPHRRATLTRFS